MIIYRSSDRIPIKIADVTFWVSPLTMDQRRKISSATKMEGGKEVVDGFKSAQFYIKFSIKEIEGLMLADGSPYELEFEPDGVLSDACVDELFQIDGCAKLITACGLLSGEYKEHKIEGVTIDLKSTKTAKKKLVKSA